MEAQQHLTKVESHQDKAGKPLEHCPDLGIKFDRDSLKDVQFNKLDQNGKETTLTLTDSFAGDLPGAQKNLFKNSIMDAMQEKVGSLSKLAQPENAAAAGKFAEMMNQGGFDVVMNKAGEGWSNLSSIAIFQRGDTEGMRFNAAPNGKKSDVCLSPDPVERNADGTHIRSSSDLGSVVRTQAKLAERVKGFLDRE